MSSPGRVVANVIAGVYTIVSVHLLAWLLAFAAVGVVFHVLALGIAYSAGFVDLDGMWAAAADRAGISTLAIRLLVALPFQVAVFTLLRRPFRRLQAGAQRIFDGIERLFLRAKGRKSHLRFAAHLLFAGVVTLLIVPFLLQPTLVSRAEGAGRWLHRLANLLDGTATLELTESVPGYYRRWWFEPRAVGGVTAEEIEQTIERIDEPVAPPASDSMMDRWDPHIRAAVGERADLFPVVKAFMYVESGGRQFAVSRTGCAGLMQFCVGTARSARYRDIFGRGAVYSCACRSGRCSVSRAVQRDLELGRFDAVQGDPSLFPCDLTDARFVPKRALAAGTKFIARLADLHGGNIYLMYIGYNSGPGVSARVWRAVGEDPRASLEIIGAHLERALAPSFGAASRSRARGLLETHLPKIARARDRYAAQAGR